MNWAKTKAKTFLIDITAYFYMTFLCSAFGFLHRGSRLMRDKKARFQAKNPISVKRRLPFLPLSSHFLNLFPLLPSRHTPYDIRYTLFKRPPILHANYPILRNKPPILRSSHPIQRNNHPRFSAWGLILQALCTVHCSLLEGVKVAGWQGVRASKRGTGIPACHPITVHCLPPNPNFHQGGA